MTVTHQLTIIRGQQTTVLDVPSGSNLRQVLLAADRLPYSRLTRRANCGGRGLCATCGIWITNGESAPQHWHDRIGSNFGYPRLSCQITIDRDMTVAIITDKWIWGQRKR